MTAAQEIVRAGRSVVVPEARDRVGGRLKDWAIAPRASVDCGQLVGLHHYRVRALARELGLSFYPPNQEGNDVFCSGGSRLMVPASGPQGVGAVIDKLTPDVVEAIKQLNEMAATVPADTPLEAPLAADWDSQTVETRIQQATTTSVARAIITTLSASRQLSRERCPCCGFWHISPRPATQARAARSSEFSGSYEFVDGEGAQQIPQGSVTTFTAIYERPFGREAGRRGRGFGLGTAFEITPPGTSLGVLSANIVGSSQRRHALKPPAERKQIVLHTFAAYFGDQALSPTEILERNHSGAACDAPLVDGDLGAQWTRGSSVALPPGVLTNYGPAIREPFGRGGDPTAGSAFLAGLTHRAYPWLEPPASIYPVTVRRWVADPSSLPRRTSWFLRAHSTLKATVRKGL